MTCGRCRAGRGTRDCPVAGGLASGHVVEHPGWPRRKQLRADQEAGERQPGADRGGLVGAAGLDGRGVQKVVIAIEETLGTGLRPVHIVDQGRHGGGLRRVHGETRILLRGEAGRERQAQAAADVDDVPVAAHRQVVDVAFHRLSPGPRAGSRPGRSRGGWAGPWRGQARSPRSGCRRLAGRPSARPWSRRPRRPSAPRGLRRRPAASGPRWARPHRRGPATRSRYCRWRSRRAARRGPPRSGSPNSPHRGPRRWRNIAPGRGAHGPGRSLPARRTPPRRRRPGRGTPAAPPPDWPR